MKNRKDDTTMMKEDIFEILDQLEKESETDIADISKLISSFLQVKARKTGTPYHGHFELTPLCNLNCKMCYVHLNSNQIEKNQLLKAEDWIEQIRQSVDAGMVKASLSGGECLTHPQFDDIYLYLKSRGIFTTVLTNGVLLDEERIRFFKKYPLQKLQISLYGDSDDTYERVTGVRSFSTVINHILRAKEENLPIVVAITPSLYLLDNIKNLIKLVKSLDVPYIINAGLLRPRDGTGREDTNHDICIEDYIDIFKFNRILNGLTLKSCKSIFFEIEERTDYKKAGIRCGAGMSTFAISWDGIMHPCSQLLSIEANPFVIGFENAWRHINVEASIYPRFNKCDNCKYSNACDFCAGENERLGSKYVLDTRWCDRTCKMVESGLRRADK